MDIQTIIDIMEEKKMHYVETKFGFLKFSGSQEGLDTYVAELFPGVFLILSDYKNVEKYVADKDVYMKNLNFSYCLSGRIEWFLENGKYTYLAKNSFMIDTMPLHVREFRFPSRELRCLTFTIDVFHLSEEMKKLFQTFDVDIDFLYQKYKGNEPYYIRDHDSIKKIFDCFRFDDFFNLSLYRVKFLEALISAQSIEQSKLRQLNYYQKMQIESVKAVEEKITRDLSKHYTIEELSKEFCISSTYLKHIFKDIYGTSIRRYLIEYRVDVAGNLLKTSDRSITEIANMVGYTNVSKFSQTFRNAKGITPHKFRNLR